MKNLKQISQELTQDITKNSEWLDREISFVIDGSYDTYQLNKYILDTYIISKTNRGKRGANLLANIGNNAIQKIYNCNSSQANSIYKYLSDEDKTELNKLVLDNLDSYMEAYAE